MLFTFHIRILSSGSSSLSAHTLVIFLAYFFTCLTGVKLHHLKLPRNETKHKPGQGGKEGKWEFVYNAYVVHKQFQMGIQPWQYLKFLEATNNRTQVVQLQAGIRNRRVFTSTKILEVKWKILIKTTCLSNTPSIIQHFLRVRQMPRL